MAWQNSSAMGGNGGSTAGSEGSGANGQPQGTEYTLQGASSRFQMQQNDRHVPIGALLSARLTEYNL